MQVRERPVYLDPSHALEDRVADLLARMTVEEKLAQIGCVWSSVLLEGDRFVEERARQLIPHGIGQVTRICGATALSPAQGAAIVNAIQKFLREETRLGIPVLVHEESLAGFMARDATCFPQAIGLAATWEPELIRQMATVIRRQMLAVGARQGLAPVLDVARDPRWGRVEETYGEDPYLIACMGVAYVKGLQGEDLREGVAATAKHFVGYGFSEGGMNWAPARIPERELREVYVLPFEAAIKEARVASIMNAYHELDGVPCGASKKLLTDLLREEFGFDGLLVADYFTVDNLRTYHRVAGDKAEAARMALEAGLDIELPASDCYGEPLLRALEDGSIDIALVDAAVRNVLRLKFRLNLFEKPYVDVGNVAEVFDTAEQRALARRIAQESIVLLKNEGDLLPLDRDLSSIAVIGPSADSIRLLQGDYHYPSHLEVMFSRGLDGMPAPGLKRPAVDQLQFVPMVTVLEGIRAKVSENTQVYHAQGCDILDESSAGFAEAVEMARKAEVAVVVVGDRSGMTPGCTSGEAIDRATLGLPGVQQRLVEAVCATGTPVIVVLLNGRPLALPWIAEHVPAVVEAWIPGEEGGAAIADVLFGDYNPGGRLPVSLPRTVGQVPVYYGHKPSGGRSQWFGDYIDASAKPLFPFGHGLSYTRFEYADLHISPGQVDPTGEVRVSVAVTNAGERSGEEVVQLYVRDVVASVTRPVKELKGFKRIRLEPGETKTVSFQLSMSQLGFYDRDMAFVVEPGEIEVMVGSSSEDIRLTGTFTITGATTRPAKKVFFSQVKVTP